MPSSHRIGKIHMLSIQITDLIVTQTVAYVIHADFRVHIILSLPSCARLIGVSFSLRLYSCASSETSDADSICSCDSSIAIGPRPPF